MRQGRDRFVPVSINQCRPAESFSEGRFDQTLSAVQVSIVAHWQLRVFGVCGTRGIRSLGLTGGGSIIEILHVVLIAV